MPKRTRDYDEWMFQQLADPKIAVNYINAAIEDSDEMFLIALRNVAEAHKMATVAKKAGVAREALYKSLSEEGNPRLATLRAVLGATGLRIAVATTESASSFHQVSQQLVDRSKTTVNKHGHSKVRRKKLQTTTDLGIMKNAIIHPSRVTPANLGDVVMIYGRQYKILRTLPASAEGHIERINEDQSGTIFSQHVVSH